MTPAPRRPTPIVVLILAAGGIGLALFCVLVGGLLLTGGSRRAPARAGLTVEYRVGGSARGAGITMQTAPGTQEQNEVGVPWSHTLTGARSGQFVYVAAQNQSDVGDVTCEIVVNGAVWKEARSGADYGIATCSGALP